MIEFSGTCRLEKSLAAITLEKSVKSCYMGAALKSFFRSLEDQKPNVLPSGRTTSSKLKSRAIGNFVIRLST
jgi:hypothetical protein